MKKGCMITLIVLAVILFAGFLGARYFFKHFLGFIATIEQTQTYITENTERLNNQFPFDEPETPSLSETQMNAFMDILRPMHQVVENDEFKQFDEEMKTKGEGGEKPSFTEATHHLQAMADSIQKASAQYFTLLEEHQLSPDEYRYIEKCVITALTIESYADRLKDKVSDEFSMDLRDRMRMERKMKSKLYDFKVQMEQMAPEEYDKIIQVITPHMQELDMLRDAFNLNFLYYFSGEMYDEGSPDDKNVQDG